MIRYCNTKKQKSWKIKFFIIAGETSGDGHAADLVKEIKVLFPQATFIGIGGDAMKKAGVHLLYHLSQLAFLGITEIVRHLPFIRKALSQVKLQLQKNIDAVILVDYPGFNLRAAKMAHKMGIPVIYYISPQLWAWGEKRVEKIRRYVDLLLVIFKFEEEFYRERQITAHFVGHPIIEQIHINKTESQFRSDNKVPDTLPILGLFPGSREMEVTNLLPTMIAAVKSLQGQFDFIAAIGCAPSLPKAIYTENISASDKIILVESQSHLLMKYSYAALAASGTATLELGFLQTPMAVLYSVSPLTYWLGKRLIKIDSIALVNIVAGEKLAPEFIQKEITVTNISNAIARFFLETDYYLDFKKRLGKIKTVLGEEGASKQAAEKIADFMA